MNITPEDYAKAAVLAKDVGEEMLSRLSWVTLQPKVIVDLGCGVGNMSELLKQRYRDATVISLDISQGMLEVASQGKTGFIGLCADGGSLPFKPGSVDMIFANFLLPWQGDMQASLKSWKKILRPDGLLTVSALGLDTLCEWRESFSGEQLPHLFDMHDIGDEMLSLGYADPVLDVEYYTMTYRDKEKFIAELYASGMLMTAEPITSDKIIWPSTELLSATYEVIFAHAFAPVPKNEVSSSENGVINIPLSHLRRSL